MRMKARNWMNKQKRGGFRGRLQKMMKCIFSGEQQRKVDETTVNSSESLATRDYSASGGFSSRTGEVEAKVDNSNIEEAESSLRESGYLNYEEARALLGRLEYQKGNVEAALHVYEGIDITAAIPKIRASISRRYENNYRRHSQNEVDPLMSMHAVSLLLEAIFLKAKSLECLGRFSEAAKSCKIILDTVESALPQGLPDNFTADCKLQETLNKVVELLPELWKLSGDFQEAILSYRRGLLYQWNLDVETKAKIEKEFAIFLLYSGVEASPPNLRFQMDGSFVPRNNVEESILLLLILLRKFAVGKIEWDPSIVDHLSFALTVSGSLKALAHVFEELPPRMLDRKELYSMLALCYYGEGESIAALNILKNLLSIRDIPVCVLELLLASKICGEKLVSIEEGIDFVHKAIKELHNGCSQRVSLANCVLGILLSAKSRSVSSDQDRALYMSKALESLETANRMTRTDRDPYIVYLLAMENAEQRKLDSALDYAKLVLKLEAGSSVKTYLLLARILSAQKRYSDAEIVINNALDETGQWEQGELWRSKAKLQIAQGELKNAIQTYGQLLAVLQVQSKSKKLRMMHKGRHDSDGSLEMETWNDLAVVYTGLSQWRDAQFCLSKSKAATPVSASRLYSTGLLFKAQGLYQEALLEFEKALTLDPNHVPSLISTASVLKHVGGCQSLPVVRSLLMDVVRLDRTNYSAWYNLGLLFMAEKNEDDSRKASTAREAAECFQAAAFLEESAPIEAFRS